MGNRAVIKMEGVDAGIYLHWNGGRDTVEPMLAVAKEYGLRGDDYGIARLTQMFGNFIGGTLSMGVNSLECLDQDNGDNGVYIIDVEFNIVGREFQRTYEQDAHDFDEMKKHIHSINDQFFFRTPAATLLPV